MSALDGLLGFTRVMWSGLTEPKTARQIVLGSNLTPVWDGANEALTINASGGSGGGGSEVTLPEPGLIDLLEADYGVGTIGGYVTEWRGRYGHVARPRDKSMTVSSIELGRDAIVFNGTSSGMTLEIPELRGNSASLIIAAQFKASSRNTGTTQVIANLWSAPETEKSVLRLDISGPSTVRTIGYISDGSSNVAARPSFNIENTEVVCEAVRDSYGSLIRCYGNGLKDASYGVAQVDVLSPQPSTTTISIGYAISESAPWYFAGVIRRIAIYGYTATAGLDAAALTRSAAWKGY